MKTVFASRSRVYSFAFIMSWIGLVGCQAFRSSSQVAEGELRSRAAAFCASGVTEGLDVRTLFDGTPDSLMNNWHSWGQAAVSSNWSVQDEAIVLQAGVKFDELVLNGAYERFALRFAWAIAPGGNSGVKYNVREASGQPIGFEYQIIDDAVHPDANLGKDGNRRTAALYDLLGPQAAVANPVGEFNQGCIVLMDRRIEHWLNGRLVVEANLDDPIFRALVAQSKFRNVANYLTVEPAQIFLQDHGDAVRFRDLILAAF